MWGHPWATTHQVLEQKIHCVHQMCVYYIHVYMMMHICKYIYRLSGQCCCPTQQAIAAPLSKPDCKMRCVSIVCIWHVQNTSHAWARWTHIYEHVYLFLLFKGSLLVPHSASLFVLNDDPVRDTYIHEFMYMNVRHIFTHLKNTVHFCNLQQLQVAKCTVLRVQVLEFRRWKLGCSSKAWSLGPHSAK